MPDNGITLCQYPSIRHLNHWYSTSGIYLCNFSILFLFWPFFKRIPDIPERSPRINEQQSNYLSSASGLEIEIMNRRDAAKGVVGCTFCAVC
ncbi:hypothetical protein EYC84_002586 [Monilinia fructicola]|uniref:Uncharacterized protein n=1 Tax=Monilinia fructicola TaxID=38448 RepID=A0A5M9JNJ3_MONFR|nr:hypothetical protein EYC84_002586 [Monilinia fructicola]